MRLFEGLDVGLPGRSPVHNVVSAMLSRTVNKAGKKIAAMKNELGHTVFILSFKAQSWASYGVLNLRQVLL